MIMWQWLVKNVWHCDMLCDITLTPNPKFKTKKIEKIENRNKKWNKNKLSPPSSTLMETRTHDIARIDVVQIFDILLHNIHVQCVL